MRKTIRSKRFVILPGLFLCLLVFLKVAGHFLSPEIHVRPDILVVEGWLPSDALIGGRDVFLRGQYKMIVTTGFPFKEGHLMGTCGEMRFKIPEMDFPADSLFRFEFELSGTPVKGIFPHFEVKSDSNLMGEGFVKRQRSPYTFTVKQTKTPAMFVLSFDNDAYNWHSDRNLYFHTLSVNRLTIPVNTSEVSVYRCNEGNLDLAEVLSPSSSMEASEFLIREGIPATSLHPIETTNIRKSRTYSTALDVKEWLSHQPGYANRTITVFTQGMHARRSLICFRKAFGKEMEIGIISFPDPKIRTDSWWKKRSGWKDVCYELSGLIYMLFIR
jgi:hypothetical protein